MEREASRPGSAGARLRNVLGAALAVLAVACGVCALISRSNGQPPIICASLGLPAMVSGFLAIRMMTDAPAAARLAAAAVGRGAASSPRGDRRQRL